MRKLEEILPTDDALLPGKYGRILKQRLKP